MARTAMTDRVIVLGVDGMDPRLTRKYVDKGLMPNLQKYLNCGAAREDLVMLGGVPTITPPMWTTLATGANPATHGITCFWLQHPTKIDTFVYANDSKNCKAEQLWNVTAEAGLKTLVFHWPGSSWPPTSDSPNLHVIEGTNPSGVNYNVGGIDAARLFFIDECYEREREVAFGGEKINGVGCVIDGLEVEEEEGAMGCMESLSMPEPQPISMNPYEGECQNYGNDEPFHVELILKPASGWANASADAKEFTMMICDGKVRRIGLLKKGESGVYDTVEIYVSKKDEKPLVCVKNDEYVAYMEDELLDANDEKHATTRGVLLLDCDPEGKSLKLWLGNALKKDCDVLWWPKHLYKDVVDNVGYVPSFELQLNLGGSPDLFDRIFFRTWRTYGDWQAAAIKYLIQQEDYKVVYSHYHNLDNYGHSLWEHHKAHGQKVEEKEATIESLFEQAYKDTDRYLGDFLPLLDEGWTVIITSDHGLICKEEPNVPPGLGDGFVINTTIMRQLGYTVMERNAKGQETRRIDYSKTKAVASRGNHIYINLKGRYEYGIVDPEDKYELERQIIDDLYAYRDPATGKRIVNMAIRNQEGALLGLSGEGCGDILYWLEEGFNRCHGDSLSTIQGYADTSVSPIFIAAGTGIKQGFYTDRVIREVDVAPTMAALLGVRMPAQCEGAPVYQIFSEEF